MQTSSFTPIRPARAGGFTLVEILTVIAIIGILAAILIPAVNGVRRSARKTQEASNMRQILQACLVYANDNGGRLPDSHLDADGKVDPTVTIAAGTAGSVKRLAAALARYTGFNEASVWVSPNDAAATQNLTTVLAADGHLNPDFAAANLSFEAVAGWTQSDAPSEPVLFTRGFLAGAASQEADSEWAAAGVYGTSGGHMAMLGGGVQWVSRVTAANTPFRTAAGERTRNFWGHLPTRDGMVELRP